MENGLRSLRRGFRRARLRRSGMFRRLDSVFLRLLRRIVLRGMLGLKAAAFHQRLKLLAGELLALQKRRRYGVQSAAAEAAWKILAEKGLDFVQFYVNFTEQILPDPKTGKKQLIRTVESEADHEYDIAG